MLYIIICLCSSPSKVSKKVNTMLRQLHTCTSAPALPPKPAGRLIAPLKGTENHKYLHSVLYSRKFLPTPLFQSASCQAFFRSVVSSVFLRTFFGRSSVLGSGVCPKNVRSRIGPDRGRSGSRQGKRGRNGKRRFFHRNVPDAKRGQKNNLHARRYPVRRHGSI